MKYFASDSQNTAQWLRRNNEAAIIEAEKLQQLAGNHLYHSLIGHLYTGVNKGLAIFANCF